MEFPRVFITGWECRECPRKLKHLSFFFMKKKMMQARRCVLCVVCWGGDQGSHAPSPMPPAPCPQPHAPNPMPLEESKASPFAWLQTRHQVHSSPQPHASCPQPHASRGEQRAPGLHACEMTLSQCPHAPSPRIQWGWGQLARIQMCAPSPILPGAGGMGLGAWDP